MEVGKLHLFAGLLGSAAVLLALKQTYWTNAQRFSWVNQEQLWEWRALSSFPNIGWCKSLHLWLYIWFLFFIVFLTGNFLAETFLSPKCLLNIYEWLSIEKWMAFLKVTTYLRVSGCKPFLLSVGKTKCFPVIEKINHFVFSMCVNRINSYPHSFLHSDNWRKHE